MLLRAIAKEKRGFIFSGAPHTHPLMNWNLYWRRKEQIMKLEINLAVFSEDLSLLAALAVFSFCLNPSLLLAVTLPVW